MGELTLHSRHLTLRLDADRGGEVTYIARADQRNALAYFDWEAPLSGSSGPSYGSTELDWLSKYQAGWQFLFPNAGAESHAAGIPVAFHGESSLARVGVLSHTETSCSIRTSARLPLELTRTIRVSLDTPTVYVEESVRNVGAVGVPFLWGHHPTFPAIAGARIDLSAGAQVAVEPTAAGGLRLEEFAWPTTLAAHGASVDVSSLPSASEELVRLLYIRDLEGWVALRNPPGSGAPSVAMSWDTEAYPFLWMWLQNGDPGFPWYGRARMLGLEPQRAWPFDGLAGAVERGQAEFIAPGETRSSWLTMTLLDDGAAPITGVSKSGHVTRG
ncbi:hypothetical protein ACFJGV_10970 [Cnuibacter sp. UC19_7]|uniref:hypothetical protein n=1 Tax=Cnuibacter sp. UC19_7 TaxID=3350166 RepID=UPI00366DF037